MSKEFHKLRLRNCSQIVAVCGNHEPFLVGAAMNNVLVLQNATLIIDKNGIIEDVGPADELEKKYAVDSHVFGLDFDMTGKSVLPGFVDCHTHPVWSGDRVHEFAMKLAGATYLDIHKAGGGIGFTVGHTRDSSEEELGFLLRSRLDRMLSLGYGLNTPTEMKMLKVINDMKDKHPIELVSTFLGAHSVPKGSTASEATECVIHEMLPELNSLKEKGVISPENVDVFLEKGVFEYEDSARILKAGQKMGLEINFHADEMNYMKGGELAGELGALAVSHLEKVSPEGIVALAKRPSFAVLLPTTAYILKLHPPPARDLILGNVPVALASDFNPNAHCMSMPFVMNLACVLMRMTMNEALVASTINAAASINRSSTHGSLEVGKCGDCIVLDSPRWEHLAYELVDPPITHVFKRGTLVHSQK